MFFYELEHEKLLVNLISDHWVTDNETEQLFSILNTQSDEVMCVAKCTNGIVLLL